MLPCVGLGGIRSGLHVLVVVMVGFGLGLLVAGLVWVFGSDLFVVGWTGRLVVVAFVDCSCLLMLWVGVVGCCAACVRLVFVATTTAVLWLYLVAFAFAPFWVAWLIVAWLIYSVDC